MMQNNDRRAAQAPCPPALGWTAEEVAALTGGRWIGAPPAGAAWKMTGICADASQFHACRRLMLLAPAGNAGLRPQQIERLHAKSLGIIAQADSSQAYAGYGCPLLEVADLRQTVTRLAAAARSQFQGIVIGVTGSVGKTSTVAMAAHALGGEGKCDRSRTTANSVYGIGWNLASMDRGAGFWVQEMSAHRMIENTSIVKPDVAIITTIAPAHLADFGSTETIARCKARIYRSMARGAIAVINGDIDEFKVIAALARAAGLRIVRFGEREGSDARLIAMDRAIVHAEILGKSCSFALGAPGRHMAMNALAVLGAIAAAGCAVEPAAERLGSFMALRGRGQRSSTVYRGKAIEIWDESYNANPGSMRAALKVMHDAGAEIARQSRVLVLGDMLELGPDAQKMHLALEDDIRSLQPDRLLFCGPLMGVLAQRLRKDFECATYPDVDTMIPELANWMRDGDVVLVKSSHGTGLSKVVDHLTGNR